MIESIARRNGLVVEARLAVEKHGKITRGTIEGVSDALIRSTLKQIEFGQDLVVYRVSPNDLRDRLKHLNETARGWRVINDAYQHWYIVFSSPKFDTKKNLDNASNVAQLVAKHYPDFEGRLQAFVDRIFGQY
jgi:hypothetical protein